MELFLHKKGFSEAKVERGYLLTGENWKYLSRFCFLSQHGKFEYDVQYDASYGVLNLDLYYDTVSQWARVYGNRADLTNCRQKESVLKVSASQMLLSSKITLQLTCLSVHTSICT